MNELNPLINQNRCVDLPLNQSIGQNSQQFDAYISSLKNLFPPHRKITLINCPVFNFSAFNLEAARNRGYYSYPPTGLQCLKASLSNFDIEVDILDLNFKILEKICLEKDESNDPHALLQLLLDEYFETHEPSLIGISAGVTVSNIFEVERHPFVECLKYAKAKNRNIVIAGGVIATNEYKQLLQRNLAHFVVAGEAENKLLYLLKELFDEQDSSQIPDIYYHWNDKIHRTEGPEDEVNFEWNVIETYQDIPIEKYNLVGSLSPFSRMVGVDKRYCNVQLNRGCRSNCSFCGVTPFMGRGVRQYPVKDVIAEIEYLVKQRGVSHFEWLDDDLLKSRSSITEVLQGIIDLNLNITWAANNGLIAVSLTEELLQTMVDSGCIGFRIGIESGDEDMLKQIRKPASKPNLLKKSKLLSKFPQIFVAGCYIIGFEKETNKQILETFRLCLEMDLSWSSWAVFQKPLEETIDNEFEADLEVDTEEHRKSSDFIPSKASADDSIQSDVSVNLEELFTDRLEKLHSQEDLDEIWFAFNFLANYVNNKYLRKGASPQPLIKWLKALLSSHPSNAIINLFYYLAHIVVGDDDVAQQYYDKTEKLLEDSPYWQKRFEQCALQPIMDRPPRNQDQIQDHLQVVRNQYSFLMKPFAKTPR